MVVEEEAEVEADAADKALRLLDWTIEGVCIAISAQNQVEHLVE